uniref:Uncharacterized protein n=1 Tax=Anopheles culicifacies TaxID=139723 RepID=A0A182MRJ6_9DIPT
MDTEPNRHQYCILLALMMIAIGYSAGGAQYLTNHLHLPTTVSSILSSRSAMATMTSTSFREPRHLITFAFNDAHEPGGGGFAYSTPVAEGSGANGSKTAQKQEAYQTCPGIVDEGRNSRVMRVVSCRTRIYIDGPGWVVRRWAGEASIAKKRNRKVEIEMKSGLLSFATANVPMLAVVEQERMCGQEKGCEKTKQARWDQRPTASGTGRFLRKPGMLLERLK